jgi:hypothetical protein
LHLDSPALLKQFLSRENRITNARNYLQSNVMRLFWFVKGFCDFCCRGASKTGQVCASKSGMMRSAEDVSLSFGLSGTEIDRVSAADKGSARTPLIVIRSPV